MYTLRFINYLVTVLFLICYSYQFIYIPLSLFRKPKESAIVPAEHSIAVLICARNEAAVIGNLIDSIRSQTYNAEKVCIFVMADNCTDDTAAIAKMAGAHVYTRFDRTQVGKGYALQALMKHLKQDFPEGFDGYLVLDADNVLSPTYLEEMNKKFSEGVDIITSYRNSKNFSSSWISAGYALYFLRESRFLNRVREMNGTSCSVSGTGFLFSRAVAEDIEDWPYHLLTEDLEFSADQVLRGRRIAYAEKAELFDEQPITFRQSWRQRMRWSRGYLQVFKRHGLGLVKGMFHGSFSCFDLTMSIAPAFILTIVSIVCNLGLGIWGALIGDDVMIAVKSIGQMIFNMYWTLFFIGAVTTAAEWKRIPASTARKLLSVLIFPLFMFTYIPISVASLFGKVTWKPITHSVNVSAKNLKRAA